MSGKWVQVTPEIRIENTADVILESDMSEHQRLKDLVVEAAKKWYASANGNTEALLPLYAAMSVLEVFEQKQ